MRDDSPLGSFLRLWTFFWGPGRHLFPVLDPTNLGMQASETDKKARLLHMSLPPKGSENC